MPSIFASVRRLAIALMCFSVAGVHADCVDTIGLSATERDFYLRADAALKSFLRPAPAGENIRTGDSGSSPDGIRVCKGEKKPGNFVVGVQRKYIWPDPAKRSADAVVTLTLQMNTEKFQWSSGANSDTYGSPSAARSAGLQVYNVAWQLSESYGTRAQLDILFASISAVLDRERMQGLVGRPLPSVAASGGVAGKLPPTALIAPPPSAQAVATVSPTTNPPPGISSPAAVSRNAPAVPAAADPVRDAVDTVNKLRGLFGR